MKKLTTIALFFTFSVPLASSKMAIVFSSKSGRSAGKNTAFSTLLA